MLKCECAEQGPIRRESKPEFVGIDETNGRFGDVSILTCEECGRKWLHYYVTYEGFSGSGRWYLGLISDQQAREVTPETAVALLESLPEHFYGGSYFNCAWAKGRGTILVDL